MITCVSDRSGTASSGVRKSAATPKPTAIRTPMTVNARCRAQPSITRSIMIGSPFLLGRAELALRRHQEVPGCDDAVAGAQPRKDFVVAARLRAELYVS